VTRTGPGILSHCRQCRASIRLVTLLRPGTRTVVVDPILVKVRMRVGAVSWKPEEQITIVTPQGQRLTGLNIVADDPTGSEIEGYVPHRCPERVA
jgi:hypothetical protein